MKRLILLLCIAILCCASALGENVPYRQRLEADVSIYSGPGDDYNFVRPVGEKGIYTIVEERTDDWGYRWGRLKSGAGWVNLTALNEDADAPIRAYFAPEKLLKEGVYHQYLVENSEYLVKIAIEPRQILHFVQFSRLDWVEDSLAATEIYCTYHQLNPGIPLVAGVVFYGDMTTYGLSFMDEGGNMRSFAFSISGKDGSLIAEEIK